MALRMAVVPTSPSSLSKAGSLALNAAAALPLHQVLGSGYWERFGACPLCPMILQYICLEKPSRYKPDLAALFLPYHLTTLGV